jgi:hypothetical protein
MKKIKILSLLTILLFSAVISVFISPAAQIPTGWLFAGTSTALTAAAYLIPSMVLGVNSFDLTKTTIENPGGCATEWHWAFWDEILTFPALPAIDAVGDPDTKALLTGSYIMKTGKQFYKGYGTLDTVSIDDESVGPYDSKSWKNIFKCDHPAVKKLLAGWLRMVQNRTIVIIAKDGSGTMRVVGNELFGANLADGKASTGAKVEDGNKASLTFESYGPCPAPIYTGTIPLTPAVAST